MDNNAFIQISTRLVKDLMDWSEEVNRRDLITTEQLVTLRTAVEIIEQATLTAVPDRTESDA